MSIISGEILFNSSIDRHKIFFCKSFVVGKLWWYTELATVLISTATTSASTPAAVRVFVIC